jgi:hypothetical protein
MGDNRLIVPAETSVLCESCGYTRDGLPTTGQCPECGAAIAQSTTSDGRKLPAWEDITADQGGICRFFSTTAAVLFKPARFYRTLATRHDNLAALRFARIHWALSAIFLAGALSIHVRWYERYLLGPPLLGGPWFVLAAAAPLTWLFLWVTTRLAARLTAWEAAYRGIRLPLPVVLRSLYFHAAHYQPVALIAFLTVAGNWLLIRWKLMSEATAQRYLIVLCIEVLLAAAYLFKTYWTGMKRVMYANR